MNVVITGGSGMVGSAIVDTLDDRYDFTIVDVEAHPEYQTEIASVTDYEALEPTFEDADAVIHLAVYAPGIIDENWERIRAVNNQGTYNVLEACREMNVPKVLFGSTNHVVGTYEAEMKPDIYRSDCDFVIDHTTPVRPDSYYGVSKLFGEHLCQFYVDRKRTPEQCYALRICSLRPPEYDHPYGDAERAVDRGEIDRESPRYDRLVARMKAMWFSRRDCADMVDRMLQDSSVSFDVFYGVSDNRRRFHDIERAKEVLGYSPQDDASEWAGPPAEQ